ncbi:hypothetical protein [Terrabacter sp. C0L_2]|nr:hypothetical protein U5C87_17920 [Terrabacter sp. C0L_2]
MSKASHDTAHEIERLNAEVKRWIERAERMHADEVRPNSRQSEA